MSDDMSDLMNNISNMLKNNEIPDEVKSFVNNFSSSSSENPSNNTTPASENNEDENRNSSNDVFPDIDIATILKLKTVMDSMKNTKDDPRANLLISLKPYLRENKREKVDQYVKLFGMSKLLEVINPSGGGIGNTLGNMFGFNTKSNSNGGGNTKK